MFDKGKLGGFAWAMVLVTGVTVPACGDDDDGDTAGDTGGDTAGDTGGDTAGDTGSDTGGGDDDGSGTDGDFVSKAITAAAGGTVAIKSEAIVQIPAGALAADTTVTIREIASTGLPEAEKLGSPVFEFGPDGTTFSTPATITLELKKAVLTGKTAFVAFLKDGAWNTLTDSAVSQDTVFATTTHFTPFAVYFADATTGGGGGESCQAFTACGGDLVGAWNYSGSQNIGCVGKGTGACEAATATGTIVSGLGDVTFTGDLKFAISRALTKSETINYPKSCAAGADAGKDCAALFPTELFPATVSENAGICEVRADNAQINESYSGTYKLSGGQLEVTFPTGAGAFASRKFEYCVQGDKLTIKETGERFTQIVTATKKP